MSETDIENEAEYLKIVQPVIDQYNSMNFDDLEFEHINSYIQALLNDNYV